MNMHPTCIPTHISCTSWHSEKVRPRGTDVPPNVATTTSVADSEMKRDDDSLETFRWDSETVVRRDTLQLVERVIEVVRRRRSVKAIETLEQVQFLVEYVDYLRTCGRVGGDSR